MLKVAVIGAGVMGSLHARIYSQLKNVQLVAICDNDLDKARTLASLYQVKYFKDYQKLLTQEKIDAVSIAVPTIFHKPVALYCIEKNINLLVEKPIASTIKDSEIISQAAAKKDIVLTVGHIERFNPAIIKLKKLIDQGVFGNLVSIVIKRVGLYPPRIKDVNVVTDLAVHDLDIVCDLLNKKPDRVFALGGAGLNNKRIDYADIMLDFGKKSCYIQVNWMTPIKVRTLSVTGTLGYCELDYITQELTLYKSNLNTDMPQNFKDFVIKFGKPKKFQIKVKKEEPLKLEIISFLKSVSKKIKPQVSPEEGVLAVKLSEIIIESIEKNKPIKFLN